MKYTRAIKNNILSFVFCFASFAVAASAQTSEFTYQGRLTDSSLPQPTSGIYQMQFALFDAAANGNQIGATVTNPSVQVTNGIFTVSLDFGANAFSGANRFLQIAVFSTATNSFVVLNPRQPVTSAPYAVKSLNSTNAQTAGNADNLGGVPASQYVQTNDSRLWNDRNPTAGSAFYIQNTTALQTADFNLNGNGAANIFSAQFQFNIGANRVLSVAGTNNTFVGLATGGANTGNDNSFFGRSAGAANNAGDYNSFFGSFAGAANSSGNGNSFFGYRAGDSNSTGAANSFFGQESGAANTTGFRNSFFGVAAGFTNTTGNNNSFFGYEAGALNATGILNSFFGESAGKANASGSRNTFIGRNTGASNTTGSFNVFVGNDAGAGNVSGSNLTIIGAGAGVGANNLTNATAIGAGAIVSGSNAVEIGTIDTTTRIKGDVVIGTGSATKELLLYGTLNTGFVNTGLAGAGGSQVCINNNFTLSYCSSSLRYKTNIAPFNAGLNLVNKLKPITFDWKTDGKHDLGLGAEDVAAVEPLLVNYNRDGQVEGVKYDRLGVVLLNAVKEQQAQIEAQTRQIQAQQSMIDGLKKIVCSQNPAAEICRQ
jgi:hypothetical protein